MTERPAHPPLSGEPRTRRLWALAPAQRGIELARDHDTYEAAVAERAAVELELIPLTDRDCRVVDTRLRALRAVDHGRDPGRAAA